MMPLPGRFLTSALVRREGELFLFDCGEGTQISLKMLNLKWKHISSIFISHMHADHVTGLPGLLMLSSQVEREEPLYIYGPDRLGDYIESSRRILDMFINYEIIFTPVREGVLVETDEYTMNCFMLRHTKVCYGYSLVEKKRPGAFSVEAALDLHVPRGPLWAQLQRGQSVMSNDGVLVHPDQVLGPAREGRKFTYITDTLYFPELADYAHDSDILFCEGMFESALEDDARSRTPSSHVTGCRSKSHSRTDQESLCERTQASSASSRSVFISLSSSFSMPSSSISIWSGVSSSAGSAKTAVSS